MTTHLLMTIILYMIYIYMLDSTYYIIQHSIYLPHAPMIINRKLMINLSYY
jgi:hypothetical protein